MVAVSLELFVVSPLHRYSGRPSDGPLSPRSNEQPRSIEIRAGLGIVGDRYFRKPAHRTASVTVFSASSLERVAFSLGVKLDAADTRRNIIVRGLDIDGMRGQEFTLDSGQGPVRFRVHRPANPCAWMDVVLAPGAHKAMRGMGGMRCEPLTSGTLTLGPALAEVEREPSLLPLF